MIRLKSLCASAPLLCLAAIHTSSSAAEFRSRPPHVHGSAMLNIALQDAGLDIEFESPAINVIGFEHEPATDQERAALLQANRTFDAGERLFVWPSGAACKQTSAQRTPITYEHDGDEEKPNAPEANYEVSYRFVCEHPEKLEWIDVRLFGVTRGMQKITATVVTPKIQRQTELTAAHTQVNLKPD
jgi:Protein of unknown function (DUF2796)